MSIKRILKNTIRDCRDEIIEEYKNKFDEYLKTQDNEIYDVYAQRALLKYNKKIFRKMISKLVDYRFEISKDQSPEHLKEIISMKNTLYNNVHSIGGIDGYITFDDGKTYYDNEENSLYEVADASLDKIINDLVYGAILPTVQNTIASAFQEHLNESSRFKKMSEELTQTLFDAMSLQHE